MPQGYGMVPKHLRLAPTRKVLEDTDGVDAPFCSDWSLSPGATQQCLWRRHSLLLPSPLFRADLIVRQLRRIIYAPIFCEHNTYQSAKRRALYMSYLILTV